MTVMNDFLAFVKQKPLPPDAPNVCPKCSSSDTEKLGHGQTLMGGANHHWVHSRCGACGLKYCYEFYDGTPQRGRPRNAWFTEQVNDLSFVLLGVPSCFESYDYTCASCGGVVRRWYTDLSGQNRVSTLSTVKRNGKWERQYRTFYGCTGCQRSIETPDDHWRPS